MMDFFLAGYGRLVRLAEKYRSEYTSLERRHTLNREYIRFQPRIVELFNKISKENGGPITLKMYCPPPEDLIVNEDFFTKGDGLRKMDNTFGEIKLIFEKAGIAATYAPKDFKEHLKEIDRVLNETKEGLQDVETASENKSAETLRVRSSFNGTSIIFNGKSCRIIPGSIQFDVVEAMFKCGADVDDKIFWERIYTEISSKPVLGFKSGKSKQRKSIVDAVRGINMITRRELNPDKDIFTARNNHIKRNY